MDVLGHPLPLGLLRVHQRRHQLAALRVRPLEAGEQPGVPDGDGDGPRHRDQEREVVAVELARAQRAEGDDAVGGAELRAPRDDAPWVAVDERD